MDPEDPYSDPDHFQNSIISSFYLFRHILKISSKSVHKFLIYLVHKHHLSKQRGTTAKSNPKQATDPISLHTKFGDNSSNTFPLNERKPCVTPDIGRRTSGGGKSKNNISTPQGVGHNHLFLVPFRTFPENFIKIHP